MKQNVKSSFIWAVIFLAAIVMGFLISIAISRRADATLHTDYAENIYNRPLINWKVEYWLDTGDEVGDTVFVAVDTTTAGGEYTLELASNRYLISAFPLWGDATDSTGSRRQWVKEEVVVVAVLDTFSFPFVHADSGFVGNITGNITGTADSADVAAIAWGPADDDFVVPDTMKAATLRATGNLAVGGDGGITGNLAVGDSATFGDHVQVDSTLTVGVDDTGYDVNFYGATSKSRFLWDESAMALRAGIATGTEWDNIGECSSAIGYNAAAPGAHGHSRGIEVQATGSYTIADGAGVLASGDYGMGQGHGVTASGYEAMAMGNFITASDTNTYVLGMGIDNTHRLENALKWSIIFGVKDTFPTMTIVDDTVTVDSVAVITGDLNVGGDADITGNLSVGDPATFGGHVQIDSTLTVGVAGTGYDISCHGDSSAARGSRIFWNADKMSFRAGLEDGLDWSDDSTGLYSFAGGYKSQAKGERAIAWGCDSEANGVASTAFGFSVVNGAYGVGLGWTKVGANYAIAIGKDTEANDVAATAIGRNVFAEGQRSMGLGNYLRADTTDAMVIGKGTNAFNLLENNIPQSIMFGMNSTTPTMTIIDDTVTVDNTIIAPEIVGALTGNATTASTCTTWTGSGAVDDTLSALKTDVVNLAATNSTQDDSLTAHKTDIAALQASKVDTNKAYVYRDNVQFMNNFSGDQTWNPLCFFSDTVVVADIWMTGLVNDTFYVHVYTSGGDTLTSTTMTGTWSLMDYYDGSPANNIIVPGDSLKVTIDEKDTGNLNNFYFRMNLFHRNP